ncbi:MAG: beta-propeller fold lactonase family protein [Leptospirales bacterium]|nr:beta-propeller fold lactonase family protein [Leptospirales bacterium]
MILLQRQITLVVCLLVAACFPPQTGYKPEYSLFGLFFPEYEQYAYLGGANGLYAFSYNVETGALAQIGSFAGADCTKGLARHPNRPFLYCLAAIGGFDTIQVFAISKGSISLASSVTLGDANYAGLYPKPSGDFLVMGHAPPSELVAYRINGDGTLTFAFLTGAGTGGAASAFSHDGAYFYTRYGGNPSFREYAVGQNTMNLLGNLDPTDNTWSVVSTPDSRFVYVSTNANAFVFSTGQGQATNFSLAARTAVMPFTTTIINSISPDGRFAFYNQGSGGNNTGTFSIDQSTGALTQISNVNSVLYGTARISPDGKFLFSTVATQYETFSVSSTGMLTRVTSPITTGITTQQPIVFFPFQK